MESKSARKKPSRPSSMLGPGFRFHPTDEELVQFYLRRKSSGKSFRFDAITDVDVYKAEPWDLPYMSKLKTRDLEWYFFSFLDKKYGNGARTNRATEKGYWKTTGKDRAVYHKRQIVGMKKTLVYHCGRAPKGQRSNWVMHEYRLAGSEVETAGVAQDAFVICRIFQKSGSGPKNGEQYGAPFVEEEWADNESEFVPQYDVTAEVDFGDNICFNSDDLQQILGRDGQLNMAPPVSSPSADGSQVGETNKSFDGTENPLMSAVNCSCEPKMCYDQNIQNFPASYDMDGIPVKYEGLGESSKSRNSDDLEFLLNEPFVDSLDKFSSADEGFIEANDLSNPFVNNTTFDMLEEYLVASDDSSLYFASDTAMNFGSEDLASSQTLLPQMNMGIGAEQSIMPNVQFFDNNTFDAAFSRDKQLPIEYQSDFQYPFIKQASRMLGDIHAPPAFAAEFPSKDAIRRLSSVARSPSSVHVSASTIQVRNLNIGGKSTDQSCGKDKNLNVVLSFGFSHGDDGSSSLESSVRIVPGKSVSAISRGWLCLIFFGIFVLSMSCRMGAYLGVE